MLNDIIKDAESRMVKAIDSLKVELGRLRTGRAHPSLLEHIRVSFYGNEMPLNQVASVSAESARSLLVTPWDKSTISAIEKAITTSDLGLNPTTAGNVIRVPLPALTEERRKSLAKVVRDQGEQARVAVRNVRRDANQSIKDLLKEKEITEDEGKRSEAHVQKTTDKWIGEIDKLISAKEAELMEV